MLLSFLLLTYSAFAAGYTASQYGRICAGNLYLKGFKWMSKDSCEQQCDARKRCDTFCWSNRSPHWDCLLYKSCHSTSTRFADGKSTSTYNCYKKSDVTCDEMTLGDCKGGTGVVKLWQDSTQFAAGTPTIAGKSRCRDLCTEAGPMFGPGCCLWGPIYKSSSLGAYLTPSDFHYTGDSTAWSCFYIKGGDHNPAWDIFDQNPNAGEYPHRKVCKAPGALKSCTSHSGCGGDRPLCKDNYCQPCLQCQFCKVGVDGTCGSCQPLYEGQCSSDAEAVYAALGKESFGAVDFAVYGFAVVGFAVLSFGAYKHYSRKTQEEHALF